MNIKNIFSGIALLLCLTFVSCSEDFLEKTDLNRISDKSFWSQKSDFEYGIMGCYDVLQSNALYGGGIYNSGIRDHDCLSDNSYNSWRWQGVAFLAEGSIDPSHAFIANFWNANYKGIARCNKVIQFLDQVDFLTENEQKNYQAEAKFLRGLFYFHLVNAYGDVPLILKPQTIEEAYVAKDSKDKVYKAILDDFEYAAANIGDNKFPRVTKGAALAMLAKAYLYNKQYDLAAEKAKDCIDLTKYSLFNDYSTLFTIDNEVNQEVIFSVRFESNLGDNNGERFSGTYKKVPQTHHQPMKNFVESFYCTDGLPITKSPLYDKSKEKLNRDPRLDVSILFNGDKLLADGTVFKLNKNRDKTGYMMQKYVRNISEFVVNGGQDFYVLRYADVLLMRAEALIESNNLTSEVYDLINQVRARVSMPKIQDVEGDKLLQGQLRDILRHERRVEFGLEGTRYYDLKRWGTLEEAYTRIKADKVPTDLRTSYIGDKLLYWPLPLSEVDNNPKLEQNPLWK